MKRVSIRYQKMQDAKRFFDILVNPKFIHLPVKVKSLAEEKEFLKNNPIKRKNNLEWNYTIIYGTEIVGGIGIKIHQSRKYIGEIGYFIDEKYWGQGIASRAVRLIEKEGFKKLGLSRIEIIMRPENKASEKVAVKNGYKKEGCLKKSLIDKRSGKMKDAWLYAKTL